MNILIVGKFYTEGFALHISEALGLMGHSVKHFEPGPKTERLKGSVGHKVDQINSIIYSATDNVPRIREYHVRGLWDIAEDNKFDVVIVCHDFLWPNEVEKLKKLTGALIALWFPDHIGVMGKGFFMNAPYDGLFFKDPFIVKTFKEGIDSPAFYLPECFNPARHFLPDEDLGDDSEYSCEITTAGNQHSWRVAFLKQLAGYDVKLWGRHAPLWLPHSNVSEMYQGRPVYNFEKVKAFRAAKIVINNLHYGEVWGVNARCFEAAGAGAFQMINWRPGIEHLFEDGKEIVTFQGLDEMKAKIDYWLKSDDERMTVAEAGMRRAHTEHTYQHRLVTLLETLAGREAGYSLPTIKYMPLTG